MDLEGRAILWRAENDKSGFQHVTPISDQAVEVLQRHRHKDPGIGESWVFPAPGDPSQPVSRHLARDWWERAEALAALEPVERRGWHSLRRRFASDMMHQPLKVVCELGGWRDFETVLKCYQHPDDAELREALAARRRAAGGAE